MAVPKEDLPTTLVPGDDLPGTSQVKPIPGGPEYKEALQGLTFGFGEEAMAKGRSLIPGQPSYEESVKAEREQLKQYEKEKPLTATGLQVAGGLAPSLVTGGIGLVTGAKPAIAKGLDVAGNLTLTAMKKYYPEAFARLPDFIKAGVTGVEAGAKYGAGAAEKPEDVPREMAVGGLVGGTVGGATSIAKTALTPVFRALFGDVDKDAATRIANAMQMDKTTPEELDRRLKAAGKPGEVTLSDVAGQNLKSLMRVGTNVPGETRESATNFLTQRQLDQFDRINEDVENMMLQGKGRDVYTLKNELDTVRKSMSDPLYKQANSIKIQNTPELIKILNAMPNEALSRGKSIYKYEMLPTPDVPGKLKDLAKKTDPIDFRIFDLVKRGLDSEINQHQQNGVYDDIGRSLINLKNTYLNYLDNANPYYKAARDAWGGPSESRDLLDQGKKIFQLNPSAVADKFSKMNPGQQQYFRMGAAEAIKDVIGGKQDMVNKARVLIGSAKNREKLRSIFPSQEAYDQFMDRMQVEKKMSETAGYLLPTSGSKTAGLLTDVGELGPEQQAGLLKDLVSLNLPGAAMRLTPKLYGATTGVTPELASSLQKSLLTPGATAGDLADRIKAARQAQARSRAITQQVGKTAAAPILLQNRKEQY